MDVRVIVRVLDGKHGNIKADVRVIVDRLDTEEVELLVSLERSREMSREETGLLE